MNSSQERKSVRSYLCVREGKKGGRERETDRERERERERERWTETGEGDRTSVTNYEEL